MSRFLREADEELGDKFAMFVMSPVAVVALAFLVAVGSIARAGRLLVVAWRSLTRS